MLEWSCLARIQSVPSDRIKEIIDFATTESPYRSANKGWITDDIFLQWGSTNEKKSKEFDQLAKISVYWQPIVQILLVLFLIVSLCSVVAFTPIYLSKGASNPIQKITSFTSNLQQVEETIQDKDQTSNTFESTPEEVIDEQNVEIEISQVVKQTSMSNPPQVSKEVASIPRKVELVQQKIAETSNKASNNAPKMSRRVTTATDLFQPKRNVVK